MASTESQPKPRSEPDRDETEASVAQLALLYERHQERTGPVQRFANRLTAGLSRPGSLAVIVTLVIAWTIGNTAARFVGSRALEEFPFPDLDFIATIAALLVALLILTTQRHEEELAERRARLTLHIAMLSEKKIAKVIGLLEEQRRDNPLLPSRPDPEASRMAQPADPAANLDHLDAAEDASQR
ncbi:DUF1003 domain-containing protein [uncultured Sphingomonas sp.]|uniref:DUF1003 domain-containing protein n=1 Tax=uncultured Sphingomonas sp. TaxID=158754 RepID=UPI0035CC1505